MAANPSPSLLARVLRVAGAAVALLVAFLCSAVLGALLHLNTAPARRLAVAQINATLGPSFKGTLLLEGVGRLATSGVAGLRARVLDPEGSPVLLAEGVRVRLSPLGLLQSALFGKGPIGIDLSLLSIDYLDVSLDADDKGTLGIQRAVESRTTTPEDPSARGLRIALSSVVVKHVWAHGRPPSAPPVDADVDGVRGSVLIAPDVTSITVDQLTLATRGMPDGADPHGEIVAALRMPAKSGGTLDAKLTFAGGVADVPVTARATMEGGHVDGVVDLPEVDAERLRALLATAPIYDKLAARVEVHGELPNVEVRAHASVGPGTADLLAELVLATDTHARVTLDLRSVDARSFAPTAPRSSAGATGTTSLTRAQDGSLSGDFTLEVLAGSVGDNVVPGASLRGDFKRNLDAAKGAVGPTLHATGTVAEAGAPTAVAVDLEPDGAGLAIDASVKTTVPRLDRIPRLGLVARGRATIDARGHVRLTDDTLSGTLDADVAEVARGGVRLEGAQLRARAAGPLAAPVLDVALRLEGLDAGGQTFSTGLVTARGPATAPEVTLALRGLNAPDVSAQAKLDLGQGVTISRPRVALSRNGTALRARAETIRLAGSDLLLTGGLVEGIGEPAHLAAHQDPAALTVQAESKGLDLALIARLLNVNRDFRGGQLAFDVDLTVKPGAFTGRADASLTHGSYRTMNDASLRVKASMTAAQLDAALNVVLPGLGSADFTAQGLAIAGLDLRKLDGLKRVRGAIDVDAKVDLAKVLSLVPPETLPLSELFGQIDVKGKLTWGRNGSALPGLVLSVRTKGLVVAGKPLNAPILGDPTVVGPPPWRASGVDLVVDATIDSATGGTVLASRLVDGTGDLATLQAKADALPYEEILASGGGAVERLESVPFTGRVAVPRRSLQQYPAVLGTQATRGDVELSLDVKGTARAPVVDLSAKGWSIASKDSPLAAPLSGVATVHYDGSEGDLKLAVASPSARVLDAVVRVRAKVADLLAREGELPWDASARARLSKFPIETISALENREISGKLSGDLLLADLHRDGRAKLALLLEDLQVGGAAYKTGRVAVTLDGRTLNASVRLDQTDGFAELGATAGVTWGRAVVPALDLSRNVEGRLQAHRFRAAALGPFVEGAVSNLDGRVEADATVAIDAQGRAPKAQGSVAFTEGQFQLADVGGEFHDVKGRLTVSPDGAIRLDDVVAYGVTGQVQAHGVAQTRGLTLASATLALKIPKGQAIPIDLQGVAMGDVYGDVDVKANGSASQDVTTVAVSIPVLHVRLPVTSSHSVQDLDKPKYVHVGIYLDKAPSAAPSGGAGAPADVVEEGALLFDAATGKTPHDSPRRFEVLPIDGDDLVKKTPAGASKSKLVATVHLGDDVRLERGPGLWVLIDGSVTAEAADKTRVTGQLGLKSGILDVEGKRFEIEKGTVTFVGKDPTNPEVVVTAGWTAPEGTQVFADFIGPVKTGKVTLRSTPPRPKSEILALIMFGTADGSSATPYASPQANDATWAGAAAGGFATEGLSRGLDQLTGLDITTRIDTSQAANPRPEVEVQIARDLSLQLAYVLGTPPPGTNPDKTFATVGWRFLRNFSLQTTFGDQGTAMADVVWQYRY